MLATHHISDRAVTADTDDEPVSLETAEERWAFAWARRDKLLAYARRRTRYPQIAADALAYALLEAGRAKARTPAALYRWLETCVRREIGREERGRGSAKSRARYANTLLLRETDTARLLDEEYESALMLRIVASLPPHLRRMFTVLGEGGTAKDVASEFGMTVKAVECLIWRTRRWCRMELAKATAACPTPLLLRGRRRAVTVLPVVALLGLALAVLVAPLLPTTPKSGDGTSERAPAVLSAPGPSPARATPTPTPTALPSDAAPAPRPGPGLIPTQTDPKDYGKDLTQRLPDGVPKVLPPVRHRNDGDRERTMQEELILCVERFVATFPRALPCQPER